MEKMWDMKTTTVPVVICAPVLDKNGVEMSIYRSCKR